MVNVSLGKKEGLTYSTIWNYPYVIKLSFNSVAFQQETKVIFYFYPKRNGKSINYCQWRGDKEMWLTCPKYHYNSGVLDTFFYINYLITTTITIISSITFIFRINELWCKS